MEHIVVKPYTDPEYTKALEKLRESLQKVIDEALKVWIIFKLNKYSSLFVSFDRKSPKGNEMLEEDNNNNDDEEESTDNGKEMETCFCLVKFKSGDIKTIQFGCGHMYHCSCIMNWLNRGHGNCPKCTRLIVDKVEFNYHGYPLLEAVNTAIFRPLINVLALFLDKIVVVMNTFSIYDKYAYYMLLSSFLCQTYIFLYFHNLVIVPLDNCSIIYYQQKDGNLSQFDDSIARHITTMFHATRWISIVYEILIMLICYIVKKTTVIFHLNYLICEQFALLIVSFTQFCIQYM